MHCSPIHPDLSNLTRKFDSMQCDWSKQYWCRQHNEMWLPFVYLMICQMKYAVQPIWYWIWLFIKYQLFICQAECVRLMHTVIEFAQAAEVSMRDFTELIERWDNWHCELKTKLFFSLNTSVELYEALKNSLQSDASRLDDIDRRTIELFLADFEQSGVHLPVEQVCIG